MLLLGIETATRHLSVALWRDGVVTEFSAETPNGGSEWLLPAIHRLLAESGARIRDLDGIAFGAGPGSFTGLRLACGVAQGIGWGLDIPLLPVSSLEALALASQRQRVWTCIDARMNEIYCATYFVEAGRVSQVVEPACLPPQAARPPTLDDLWGAGDGFAAYPQLINASSHGLAGILPAVVPRASDVLRIAVPGFDGAQGLPAAAAQPRYVRDKVALTTAERLARGGQR